MPGQNLEQHLTILKRSSAREHITQILLDRIIDGTYKPGERLIELQIANELSTSQARESASRQEVAAEGS